MKRLIGLAICVVSVLGIGVGSATADYPVGVPTVATSNASPQAGALVTITVSGWCANATVTFSSSAVPVGSTITDAGGNGSIDINVPAALGPFVVDAETTGTCIASGSVTMNVVAAPSIPSGGSDSTLNGVQLGAISVGVGATLIGFAALRRRRLAAV